MASKKLADHTKYHLAPKGFWKKFRDAVVVNPDISSGLPLASINRFPPPASRPETYATPATKASDPAQNPYWKRDVRRAYPRLSVVTQTQLAGFLLQSPEVQKSLPQSAEGQASVPATQDEIDLVSAINKVAEVTKTSPESTLPPAMPTPFKRWRPSEGSDLPHDPNAYFPMKLVT